MKKTNKVCSLKEMCILVVAAQINAFNIFFLLKSNCEFEYVQTLIRSVTMDSTWKVVIIQIHVLQVVFVSQVQNTLAEYLSGLFRS